MLACALQMLAVIVAAASVQAVPAAPGGTPVTVPAIDMGRARDAVEQACDLPGAHFGLAVIDLRSGDTEIASDGGFFDSGTGRLVAAAMAAGRGDSLVADPGAVGAGRISGWLETAGLGGTFVTGADAAGDGVGLEVLTTPGDAVAMLRLVAGSLGSPAVRGALAEPFSGTPLEDLESDSVNAFGTFEEGAGFASISVVAACADGRLAGLVVLADGLCCPEKAELAFRILWEAVI